MPKKKEIVSVYMDSEALQFFDETRGEKSLSKHISDILVGYYEIKKSQNNDDEYKRVLENG